MLMPGIFGENLFDDWMDFSFPQMEVSNFQKRVKSEMRTDVRETEQGYELDIDLPGYKKEEINAQLENGYLTIQASRNLDKDEKDKEGNYIRRERYTGAMSRSFYVGDDVKQEDISAKFEDGILKLSIPKKQEQPVPEKKFIAIEG